MAAIFCEKFLFENWHGYSAEIPCGAKISSKSLYLAGFSRYKHFYVLQFLRKIRKFKMAAYSEDIPCGSKISSKSLYLARFSRYKHFCENFENSKWPPFLARQKFFENWEKYSAEISCRSKILSKLLYLARFLRYKHFCVLQFLRKFRKFKMAAILGETKIF